jgi:hypothetical protein
VRRLKPLRRSRCQARSGRALVLALINANCTKRPESGGLAQPTRLPRAPSHVGAVVQIQGRQRHALPPGKHQQKRAVETHRHFAVQSKISSLPLGFFFNDETLSAGVVVVRTWSLRVEVTASLVACAPQIIDIQAAARSPVVRGANREAMSCSKFHEIAVPFPGVCPPLNMPGRSPFQPPSKSKFSKVPTKNRLSTVSVWPKRRVPSASVPT